MIKYNDPKLGFVLDLETSAGKLWSF